MPHFDDWHSLSLTASTLHFYNFLIYKRKRREKIIEKMNGEILKGYNVCVHICVYFSAFSLLLASLLPYCLTSVRRAYGAHRVSCKREDLNCCKVLLAANLPTLKLRFPFTNSIHLVTSFTDWLTILLYPSGFFFDTNSPWPFWQPQHIFYLHFEFSLRAFLLDSTEGNVTVW